ncbi:MAG: GxxExxY protein [Bacteroidota bacterium]|nr:GxxExxY protein [Bacteroidota bacterium]
MLSKNKYDEITSAIIGDAIEVHKELGPGLLESVYEVCLQKLLIKKGLSVKRQVQLPINFQGEVLEKDFFIDMLIEDEIIIELKSVEGLLPIHEAQLLTYLKLSGKQVGLLINFNVVLLKDGIKRRVMGYIQ